MTNAVAASPSSRPKGTTGMAWRAHPRASDENIGTEAGTIPSACQPKISSTTHLVSTTGGVAVKSALSLPAN